MSFANIVVSGLVSREPKYQLSQSNTEYAVFSIAVNNINFGKKTENYFICKVFPPILERFKTLNILTGTRLVVAGAFDMQFYNGRTYPNVKVNQVEVLTGKSKEVGEYEPDPLKPEIRVTNNTYDNLENDNYILNEPDFSVFGD